MQDLDMKKKVAQEIIALMDEKEGERLKKHPKIVGASVEVKKEAPADELEMGAEEEMADEPKLAVDPEVAGTSEDELTPELIEKLLEMMKDKQV